FWVEQKDIAESLSAWASRQARPQCNVGNAQENTGAALTGSNFWAGAAYGAKVGAASGFFSSAVSSWISGESFVRGIKSGLKGALIGGVIGGAIGGISNGINASRHGGNF
ncbi:MAG: hypothetical protein AAF934_03275, partial [Bacteroidota bacterium]